MIRTTAVSLLLIFVGTLAGASPKTEVRPAQGDTLDLHWIDPQGQHSISAGADRMKWVWSKASTRDRIESPAIRIWISSELPNDWQPVATEGDGVTLTEPYRNPFQTLIVDLRKQHGTLRVTFRDSKDATHELSLAVQASALNKRLMTHENCGALDIEVQILKSESQNLYSGINCVENNNQIEVYFFRSLDSKWASKPGFIAFDPTNKYTAFKTQFLNLAKDRAESRALFKVSIQDSSGHSSDYKVWQRKLNPEKFLFAELGADLSYDSYSDKAGKISSSQIATLARLTVGAHLIQKKLDAAILSSVELFSLMHSPGSLPWARFYSVEPRLLGKVFEHDKDLEFWLFGGWAFWGMSVSGHAYGIENLGGPEIGLQIVHSYRINLKLASLADRLSLFSSGINLSGEIGIPLTEDPNPWSVNLGLNYMTSDFSTISGGMKLLRVSGGIQKNL